MKKFILAGFLMLFISQLTVFAQDVSNSEELAKRISAVKDNLTGISIDLSESMIHELNRTTEPGILLSMKSIHGFAQEYSEFLLYETTLIMMYPYLSESVKLYFAAKLRDQLKQKRKEVRYFMASLANHESKIMNQEILETIAKMRNQIEDGQMVIDQIIKYYSSEYRIYKEDNR